MKPKKPTLEDQLAFIATQHEVYPTELFQALVDAKDQGKSMTVSDLTVEYRGNVTNQAIFLIRQKSSCTVPSTRRNTRKNGCFIR